MITQVDKISICWRNNVGNVNFFIISIASIYASNAVFTKQIYILRKSICWIFYVIHHGPITFCDSLTKELIQITAPGSFTSMYFFHFLPLWSTFQFDPSLSPNSNMPGFLSNNVHSSPSVSFCWQCDPIAPSSHWRHEYLALKLEVFKFWSTFSIFIIVISVIFILVYKSIKTEQRLSLISLFLYDKNLRLVF